MSLFERQKNDDLKIVKILVGCFFGLKTPKNFQFRRKYAVAIVFTYLKKRIILRYPRLYSEISVPLFGRQISNFNDNCKNFVDEQFFLKPLKKKSTWRKV